jgi:predicted Zn-dependent protease
MSLRGYSSFGAFQLAVIFLECTCLSLLFIVHSFGQASQSQNPVELLNKGRVEEARRVLIEALRRDPNNEQINVLLGQIAFSRKEYVQAVTRFRKSPSVLANNPLLLVNYAEALLETKSVDLAKRQLERLQTRNAAAQFEAGLLLARFGEYLAAEKHFKLAQSGYPQPEVVAFNLALTQYRAGEFTESIATLEEMRQRGFKTGDVLNLLGEAYAETGQSKKALDILQEAARNNPKDERNYLAIARLAIEEDMAVAGLQLLDQGLRHLPKSYPLLLQRGYLLLSQGQYREAESDYRSAIQTQAASDSARIGLAFVLLQSQRQSEAANLLQGVIQSSPSNFFAHYLLGELRIREGLDDEALMHLEKAGALQPGFAAVHTNLGRLYLKKNDLSSAIRELEAGIRFDPEDTTAYYQLSIAYRKMGEKQKAQTALAQVRRLNEEERELGTSRFLTRKFRKARSSATSPF